MVMSRGQTLVSPIFAGMEGELSLYFKAWTTLPSSVGIEVVAPVQLARHKPR